MKDRYFELRNLIVAILLLSVLVSGCKKGDQTLGIDSLPGVSILKTFLFTNKTPITTSIITDKKIRVDHPGYNLLGSFNDPVFGRTDASFAAQFRLQYHPDYKASASIDSIILRLTYKSIYGDTISRQTLQVFELADDLVYETKYFSSFNLKNYASPEPIGTSSFIPKFKTDSLKTDTTLQIIRVPLNPSFGNFLLRVDSLKMNSNDEFLKTFKGLFISSTPVNRRGTLVSIYNTQLSTATVETRPMIILYYHDAKSDTLGYNYRLTNNSANVASYFHDYTLARFKPNLDNQNNLDSLIYIQPNAGVKSKILVPSLSSWKDSVNFSIDKATLTIHVDTIISDYRRYEMPARLYLMRDSTDTELFPKDATISNAYYGGYYDAATATYSFNVTQHLQDLIVGLKNGKMANEGFFLIPSDRNSSAKRVVLKGLGSTKPVELNITYTKYK